MKPTSAAATDRRPNRVLIALAAAWMILSLALGGAVAAESRAGASGTTAETTITINAER